VAERNLVYEVLILRARESPGGSRILALLSAEAGLVDAFVFGGPKSKLRSLASPYSSGRAFLYHDPVRDFLKLSDFEVREPFIGIREGLRRLWATGLVAEIILATAGGGGDFPLVLDLARETLRAIETCPEERVDYPLLLFLWRLLDLIGLLPDTASCVGCGRELDEGRSLAWAGAEGGFLCPRCSGGEEERGDGHSRISAGAVRWLERAAASDFPTALKASLDASSLAGLKALVFDLAQRATDAPLRSLSSGAGIL
jgi:DNA repair protein RecO (recombination protein O)